MIEPTKLEDIIGNEYNIKLICNWINKLNTKLLIINGPSGIGKTLIAKFVFDKFNYNYVEFNINDYVEIKKFKHNITQLLKCNNNLSLYKNNNINTKFGIIIDNINQLCVTDIKYAMFNELINIIKKNNNFNPIICTCDIPSNNKKLKELKKYGTEIKLNTPNKGEIIQYLYDYFESKNIEICDESINLLISETQYDIRQLHFLIQIFLINYKDNKIKFEDLKTFILSSYKKKRLNRSLNDITYNIFNNNIDSEYILNYNYDNISIMIYENYINQLNSKDIDSNDFASAAYKNIDSLSFNNYYNINNNYIYDINNYYTLIQSLETNIIYNKLKNKKNSNKALEYPTLLNKKSQYSKNIKFFNNNFNIDNIDSISKIINYNIFNKNGNIDKAKQLLHKYKLNENDILSLIRIDKFNNANIKFTSKIKKILLT